ncbi:MAG: hypothetical protein COX65_07255 [Elusimicrobia bacterium CG_4_10_14_0_2_um_filter_56_8]|nr:MAG: hypothetical protein AUJ51_04760 [Elusimicrobia bacterium CG1_02_56_21]PJA13349.1 MAG: hypothetical protein COX65_07255 [Elusimicrobia bacterium CG_4_10_14_0_2_um_filter_56_8]
MKNIKLIGGDEASFLYQVKDYSQVSEKLIESLLWPFSVPYLFLDFKPLALPAGSLKHKISKKYSVRYIFGGKRQALKQLGKGLKNSPIELRAPKNLKEAKDLSRKSISEHYIKPNARLLGPDFNKETKRYISSMEMVKSALLFKKGRNVGIVSLMDSVRPDGKPVSVVTWEWIDKKLPTAEFNDALFRVSKWIRENVKETLGWYTHDFCAEEQKLCTKLGLKPYRIFFSRNK